ncbi:wax ester/triacylglycerol synthase domain-containing protein [Mycobacterium sp. Z3061]|uniref:wax ester/triacylglycerol synthase domain-containing protein n=1 Tax=Mycobacterium sp. Z3061 TaxID=3073562 RepID=UPI0028774016|nr:wax ester/triacylglycerol synthase domain-containing protein [Mycobacterium sp. Z3061]
MCDTLVTRLSGPAALSLQTEGPSTPAHSVAIIILDGSDRLSHQSLHQLVVSSLPRLARFRSRLVTKPLGIGHPVWAEIADYDPSEHIHRATAPAPGGRAELARLVAELSSGHRECRERLWEAWTVDGLADGRWALVVRMSPVLNDRFAGWASLWPRLLSRGPHLGVVDDLPTEPSLGTAPSVGELVIDMVTEIVENQVTGAWLIAETVLGALQTAHGRLLGADRHRSAPTSSQPTRPTPQTAFNSPLTKRRAVAFTTLSLADVRAVSKAFGGSDTNVMLAACTLSLRAWLRRQDQLPADPLSMRIPFELPASDPARVGRTLSVGRLRLPVHLDDPVQVLAILHTATERLNTVRRGTDESSYSAVDFMAITSLVPPNIARVAMQLYTRCGLRRLFEPTCHGSISYVVVGPTPAYCAGSRVAGVHALSPLAESSGLNIAFTARGDELDVSVYACPDNVPAIDDIATGIVDSIKVLRAAAQDSPRGQGRSVVTEMASHPANRSRGRMY